MYGFLLVPQKGFPPQAHLDTKGAVTLCFSDLTVCSFKNARLRAVLAVEGFCACVCINASVCVVAVTCSLCSVRTLSLGEPLIWSTGDSYSVK